MFDNISGKIKFLAILITISGILLSIIYGLILIFKYNGLELTGCLVIIFGSLSSWIGSFLLYGFGEIITQLQESNRQSAKIYALLNSNKDTKIENKTFVTETKHSWRCNFCGEMIDETPCPKCGKD